MALESPKNHHKLFWFAIAFASDVIFCICVAWNFVYIFWFNYEILKPSDKCRLEPKWNKDREIEK